MSIPDTNLSIRCIVLFSANLLLGALAATVFVFFGLPGKGLFWSSLQNAGHGLVFMLLTFVALLSFAVCRAELKWATIVVIGGLFMLGLAVELGQHLTGRGASFVDIGMNAAGLLAGYSFFMALCSAKRHVASGLEIKRYKFHACVFLFAGLTILFWNLRLPISYLIVEQLEAEQPVLTDFNNLGAGLKIRSNNSSFNIESSEDSWPSNKTRYLALRFNPGIWPSVQFLEPSLDWSAYSGITFVALNPQEHSISVSVRIDDSTLGEHDNDHMTVARELPTGESLVSIKFDEFRANARNRNLAGLPTFTEMQSFMVFVPVVKDEVVLFFDEFRLE